MLICGDSVSIFLHPKSDLSVENRLKIHFKTKIETYRYQDKKANRPYNKDDCINVGNVGYVNNSKNKLDVMDMVTMYAVVHLKDIWMKIINHKQI